MLSLVLDRPDVVRHLDALSLMSWMREGFVAQSRSPSTGEEDGAVRCPGEGSALPAYARWIDAPLPGGDGEVAPRVLLFDAGSDRLLALMDAGHLRAITSAVSCAVAADVLARPDAVRVAIVGAGAHAGAQLKSLRLVRSLEHVRVVDLDLERMATFAHRMYRALSVPVRMAGSVEEAVADADLVVSITDAHEPLVFPGMVGPGCHVTSVGADVPGHRELSASLIRQSTFFCDDRRRALGEGALPALGVGEEAVAAELGEVLTGAHPGRTSADEVTLFAAYGLPHQLLAAAWLVYLAAREDDAIPRMALDTAGRPLA